MVRNSFFSTQRWTVQLGRVTWLAAALAIWAVMPAAQAVNVSANGQGEVLIYPYYSLRDDNDTLFSVTNHTAQVKAVKVRVLEGEAGRTVTSFNLYLAPFDTWSGSITDHRDLGPSIIQPLLNNGEPSCTVPSPLVLPLNLERLAADPDSGRTSDDRAFEGYVEIIEMGTVSTQGLGNNALFFFSRGSSQPRNCEALNAAWEDSDQPGSLPGIWTQEVQTDMNPPTGGLSGQAIVIKVNDARATPYDAIALENFYRPVEADDPPSLNSAPDSDFPNLNAANPATSVVRTDNGEMPVIISDTWPNGALAVTAALMSNEVRNQYANEAVISGRTEWVMTFPTKGFLTQPGSSADAPFTATFDEPVMGEGDGEACEAVILAPYTRHGATVPESDVVGVPPPPPPDPVLCYAVNSITFGNSQQSLGPATNETNGIQSDLLASRLFIDFMLNFLPTAEAGWASVNFNGEGISGNFIEHRLTNANSGRIYHGLPVVGFAAAAATNRNINALFGTGFAHEHIVTVTQ